MNGGGIEAQLERLEHEARAGIDAGRDIEIPIGAISSAAEGPGSDTVKASKVLRDLDDDADFLEQVATCMPKEIRNG